MGRKSKPEATTTNGNDYIYSQYSVYNEDYVKEQPNVSYWK